MINTEKLKILKTSVCPPQSLPVTSNPAERPSSKPKKKKVVGLFR